MPSINIYERDLTSPYSVDTTPNIVYIPGYANIGPTNEPVLCTSLNEFYTIFGKKPYQFRSTQGYPEITVKEGTSDVGVSYRFRKAATEKLGANPSFYQVGDYEKSYMIAAELLSKNLPVLFERIVSEVDTNYAYASIAGLKFTSKIYGLAGSLITVKLENLNNNIYKLTITFASSSDTSKVGDAASGEIAANALASILGVSEVTESITFTTSKDSTSNYTYISDIVSELVTISENEITGVIPDTATRLTSATLKLNSDEFEITDIYKAFLQSSSVTDSVLNILKDKGTYQVKFLTLGAYPSFEFGKVVEDDVSGTYQVFNNLIETAGMRGDCIALVDYTDQKNARTLNPSDDSSVYRSLVSYEQAKVTITRVGGESEDAYTYAAMFAPYGTYRLSVMNNNEVILPASFGYLSALATSTQSNPNWYAIAGVSRGIPSGLVSLSQNMTNAIADLYQPRDGVAINCITNIKPYGYTIWGNRTLKDNSVDGDLKALSFLNIRILTSDLKKVLYQACKRYTFENNTDIMWLNFKSQIEPTLAKMLSGNGIASYQIIKVATTKKATIEAIIRLVPIEPVEDWYITIELTDGVEANIQ